MNGTPEHSSNPLPLFPFTIGENFSAYLFKNNAPPLFRMILLKEGGLSFTTEQERHRIECPAIFCLPPTLRCSLKTFRASRTVYMSFGQHILDQCSLYSWRSRNLQTYVQKLWSSTGQPAKLTPPLASRVESITDNIVGEEKEKKPGYEIIIIQMILQLFILLHRQAEPGSVKHSTHLWQVDDVISYINENYSEEFTLQDIAEKYSISPSYFSRKFKDKTGTPLFEYINNVRIRKACNMLKRSREAIIEIAYAVGYNNISFFNRYFRKIMKMSPREFRNYAQK